MSDKRTVFIPAWLDDFGLDVYEFRLYCRIARRGRCTESTSSMAKALRISRNKIYEALNSLLEKRLIEDDPRPGLTTAYRLLPVSDQVQVPVSNEVQVEDDTRIESGTGGVSNQVRVPVSNQIHEGTPLEGTPIKDEKTPTSVGSKNGSEDHPITDDQTDTDSPSKLPSSKTSSPPRSDSKSKRFQKPTAEQIRDYFKERNAADEAQAFFDYHESKGWIVGRSPMKDWKAAVRTWINHDFSGKQAAHGKKKDRYAHIPEPGTVVIK